MKASTDRLIKCKIKSCGIEDSFSLLNMAIQNTSTVVFLDEISWMAQGDKDFAGKLKIAWDTELKHHNKLILVLCGSVSSWLEENILNNTGFAGRVSLDLKLEELDLASCVRFWGKNHSSISTMEKLKLLSVTGGVPRYLEEIRPELSAEQNIHHMCFKREGFLFSEFEHIFSSIHSLQHNFLHSTHSRTQSLQTASSHTGHSPDCLASEDRGIEPRGGAEFRRGHESELQRREVHHPVAVKRGHGKRRLAAGYL